MQSIQDIQAQLAQQSQWQAQQDADKRRQQEQKRPYSPSHMSINGFTVGVSRKINCITLSCTVDPFNHEQNKRPEGYIEVIEHYGFEDGRGVSQEQPAWLYLSKDKR